MTPFAFDTETWPIAPGLQAPLVVCGQYMSPGRAPVVTLAAEFKAVFMAKAADPAVLLVGHNVAYDMACICATWPDLVPTVLDLYEADRVTCTFVRELLIRIAKGTERTFQGHSLIACVERYKIPHAYQTTAGHKDEYWRTRYSQLRDTPVIDWPANATRYALEDARCTLAVYEAQGNQWVEDQFRQARAAFWLQLVSCWGMRVDQTHVERLGQAIEQEAVILRNDLTLVGIVRPNGTKDTKAAKQRMVEVRTRLGLPIPVTKTARERELAWPCDLKYVATDADACDSTGDNLLKAYARFGSLKTLRTRVARLRAAGDLPIQARYSVLKETGRTSASKGKDPKPGQAIMAYGDQVQNLNREAGLRECYVPRPGHVFAAVDWAAAELHTLAQTCVDMGLRSNLARVLNSGKDVHMWFGAEMRGWSYDWAQEALQGAHGAEAKTQAKLARSMAKAANFGFPGGLGIDTFRSFAAKTYGVMLSEAEASELKGAWFAAFPEMLEYFAAINALIESGQPMRHAKSNRYRGRLTYCPACNSPFQGRAADMAKEAGWWLLRAQHRVVAFIHDEFLCEVPRETAHESAAGIVEIMENAGRVWCPDVPVRAVASLSYRWRKAAEPAFDLDGRLIPWEDRPAGGPHSAGPDKILSNWEHGREYD